ncbi:MAG TPA: hypothetical protein PKN33_10790 [Phycisphaerae bacterium]|nr:hypothetical protein [Phycisphaerae bacterium]
MTTNAIRTQPASLGNVLIARNKVCDRRSACIQLFLIVVWHWTVFAGTLDLVEQEFRYHPSDRGLAIGRIQLEFQYIAEFICSTPAATVMLAVVCVEGILSLVWFRFATRKLKPTFSVFTKYWWRACLWGTFGLPVTSVIIAELSWGYDFAINAPLLWVVCAAVVIPMLLRADLNRKTQDHCLRCGNAMACGQRHCTHCDLELPLPQMRVSRWRPVCPDCGYSIRRAIEHRCPECGVPFPTASKCFRRWATLRLSWDRQSREFIGKAYLKSLLRIVFTPAKAARGLAISDHWGRAARWTLAHLALVGVVATLLSNGQQYLIWLILKLYPSAAQNRAFRVWDEHSTDRMLTWAGQSLLAWMIVLFLTVAIGCLVSYLAPRRHRAAKLGGIKWSLYVVPVMFFATVGSYLCESLFARPYLGWQQAQSARVTIPWYNFPTEEMPVFVPVLTYGIWWAIGLAANQYNARRSCFAFLPYLWAYYGIWFLLTRLLFPVGSLETLL